MQFVIKERKPALPSENVSQADRLIDGRTDTSSILMLQSKPCCRASMLLQPYSVHSVSQNMEVLLEDPFYHRVVTFQLPSGCLENETVRWANKGERNEIHMNKKINGKKWMYTDRRTVCVGKGPPHPDWTQGPAEILSRVTLQEKKQYKMWHK